MWEPDGGNVDPPALQSLCYRCSFKWGRDLRFTPVIGTNKIRMAWNIRTEKGDIHTEWVVNAAGLWGEKLEEWLI